MIRIWKGWTPITSASPNFRRLSRPMHRSGWRCAREERRRGVAVPSISHRLLLTRGSAGMGVAVGHLVHPQQDESIALDRTLAFPAFPLSRLGGPISSPRTHLTRRTRRGTTPLVPGY